MKKQVLLIFALFSLSVSAQTQLITNGNFSGLSTGWTISGNWHVSSSFSCYNSSTAYAYAGDASGNPVINESGNLIQTVTIPSNATSATLSFYTSQNTQETTTTTSFDYIEVYFYNSSGTTNLATWAHISNLNAASYPGCQSYGFHSYNVSAYIGQTVQLWFHVFSDGGPKNTMFRVDDVSLTATVPNCSYSISPSSISPTSSSGSGSVSVTATSGCSWTAVSNNTSWLTVTSGNNGTGNGTVSYSYTSNNSSSPRSGTITIAGQTFTVVQSGTTTSLLHGVDVSRHNGVITWSQVYSTNHSFAFVKATEGVCSIDSKFLTNMNNAYPGVTMGAYHFGLPSDNTALAEANYFLNTAGSYIGTGYLPPALDIENPSNDGCSINFPSLPSGSILAQWINAWCVQVHAVKGIWPVLYTTRCIANQLVSFYNGTINSNIKLWIADYPETAGSPVGYTGCGPNWNTWPWVFHQYFVPSVNGAGNNPTEYADPGMDQDVFYGTPTDFSNLIGGGTSATATITNLTISPSTVCPTGTFTMTFTINATGQINNVLLGASIILSGGSTYISDTPHDIYVGTINAGTSTQTRQFTVSAGTTLGTYDVVAGLWQDINGNHLIDGGIDLSLNNKTNTGALNLSCPSCADNYEPNPSCAQATPIFANPLGVGTSNYSPPGTNIGFVGDEDWYSLQLSACGTLTITLSNLPYDYDLQLYGGGCPGAQLAVSNNGSTTSEQIIYTNTTATLSPYYIYIYAYNGTDYTTASCYNLNVQWTSSSVTPSASILASPSTTVCENQTVTFSANVSNGGSSPTYQWYLNNVPNSTSPTFQVTSGVVGTYSVYCRVTSNANCVSSTTATSNTVTVTVNPVGTAGVSIAASPSTTTCSGQAVTFTATPINGGSSPIYQWKTNGTNVGINSNTYSNSSLNTGDQIQCTLTSNANCVSGIPASSNIIPVSVNYCPLIFNLKVFIEGFYVGNGHMKSILYDNYLTTDATACDSITVELHSAISPYNLTYSKKGVININGNGSFVFPAVTSNVSYYIVVKHRNAIETWSKYSVLFDSPIINFDFTLP